MFNYVSGVENGIHLLLYYTEMDFRVEQINSYLNNLYLHSIRNNACAFRSNINYCNRDKSEVVRRPSSICSTTDYKREDESLYIRLTDRGIIIFYVKFAKRRLLTFGDVKSAKSPLSFTLYIYNIIYILCTRT